MDCQDLLSSISVYKCLSDTLLERFLQHKSACGTWGLLAMNYFLVHKVVSDRFLLTAALNTIAAGSNAQFCARVIPY